MIEVFAKLFFKNGYLKLFFVCLIGGLLWDEMATSPALRWNNNKMHGFEQLPGMNDEDFQYAKISTEVILFMFTAINDNVKLPVAYYFTSPTTSDSRYLLAQKVMEAVIDSGVHLTSITFDGHASNPGECTSLGANLDIFSNDFNPSFYVNSKRIHILLDPSHMMKMFRGAIGNKKIIYDAENKPIKWIYFERLVNFKERRNFHSMHKMTQAHIDFHKNAMKVILAIQTLSHRTADAIEYLMKQGYAQFKGAEPTITFIRMCANIFYVLNSTRKSQEQVCGFLGVK